MVTKDYLIKEVGSKTNAEGMVLTVTLAVPPTTINGMVLLSVEQPVVYEVPTTLETLVADLTAYAAGNTVPVSFGAPIAPAPAKAIAATTPAAPATA